MTFISWTEPGEVRYVPVAMITGIEFIDHGGMPMTLINTVGGATYTISGNAVRKIMSELKKTEQSFRIISVTE